ncbi:MAG TPA: Gldg family protein [Thiolinea sp.]|nr:Gldg family protein [Thiolinea sp.]
MKMTKGMHRSIGVQNAIFYILLFTALGLLAFLSREFHFQADWTYGNRNSLTETTRTLLSKVDQPLKFVAYVPDDPSLQEQLRKLITKYQRVKPDIQLEFVNPDLDPVRAKQDGIQYAGQISIHLGDRNEVVEETSESAIANAIQRMSRGGERLVVFLEGHGERDPLATTSTGLSQFLSTLERSGFKVQPHNLVRTQSIPQNARFLVIAAPQKDLLSGEVDLLKKYVEQGGNLLWLQDPGGLHGLKPLADILGLKISEGTVLDANEQLHEVLGVSHPAIVPVVDYGRSPIAEKLTGSQSLFPFATMVEHNPAEDKDGLVWQTEELLNTLPNSWLETGTIDGAVTYEEDKGDVLGPVSIGLTLTRLLDQPEEAKPVQTASPKAERQQRIVVIGDSDFMINSFIGKGVNLDLATNIFNWLSADDNLLNIQATKAPDTSFEMGETSSLVLASFFLIVLPLSLILLGSFIWLRRRRR